ncbi:heat shock 70 kDa protein 15-like protein [Tanacetum coccineum]
MALAEAELTVGDIYVVEVVGSGSRVPAVIKILTEFFRKDPKRTMNACECVSKGCALECAILSLTFKVRELQVQESFPFSIALTWKGTTQDLQDGTVENQQSIIFLKGNLIPSVNALTFFRSGIFLIDFQYANVSELQAPAAISTYMVKVKARLNLHGIVSVDSAQLIEEEEVEVPVMGLEVSWIQRIQELDTAYWGFLGVGTTLDIFQNIILIPCLEYDVLSPLDTTRDEYSIISLAGYTSSTAKAKE